MRGLGGCAVLCHGRLKEGLVRFRNKRVLIGTTSRGWGGRAQDPARKAPPYPAGRVGGACGARCGCYRIPRLGRLGLRGGKPVALPAQAWWRAWLRPGNIEAPLALAILWLAALLVLLVAAAAAAAGGGADHVVAMVVIGGVLTCAALTPCRGGQTEGAVVGLDARPVRRQSRRRTRSAPASYHRRWPSSTGAPSAWRRPWRERWRWPRCCGGSRWAGCGPGWCGT